MSLITAKEIIDSNTAPIAIRFDAKLLTPHILVAINRHLKPYLCDFYDNLVADKSTGVFQDIDYQKLFDDHLLPYLSNCVMYEAYPFIAVKLGSNGVLIGNTEHAESGQLKAVKYMQDVLLERIEAMRIDLLSYLDINHNKFIGLCKKKCSDETKSSTDKHLGIIFY